MVKRKIKMEIIAEIGQNHNGDMVLAKERFAQRKWCRCCQISDFDGRNFGTKITPWIDYNKN